MKAIMAQAMLQAVLLVGIVALSSGPALGGSVPECESYSYSGCAQGPAGGTCNDFQGAETCHELTGASPSCALTTVACDAHACSGSEVWIECEYEQPQ